MPSSVCVIYVPATPAGAEVGLGGASLSYEFTPSGSVAVDQYPPPVGGQTPAPVQAPFLEINFYICVEGLYPPRP